MLHEFCSKLYFYICEKIADEKLHFCVETSHYEEIKIIKNASLNIHLMDSGTVSVILEHKVHNSKLFCIFKIYTALCLLFNIYNHNVFLIRLVMHFIIDLILWSPSNCQIPGC